MDGEVGRRGVGWGGELYEVFFWISFFCWFSSRRNKNKDMMSRYGREKKNNGKVLGLWRG